MGTLLSLLSDANSMPALAWRDRPFLAGKAAPVFLSGRKFAPKSGPFFGHDPPPLGGTAGGSLGMKFAKILITIREVFQ
jgi:hypothetical protein